MHDFIENGKRLTFLVERDDGVFCQFEFHGTSCFSIDSCVEEKVEEAKGGSSDPKIKSVWPCFFGLFLVVTFLFPIGCLFNVSFSPLAANG